MADKEQVVKFPKNPTAPIFYPTYVTTNEGYRHSLADRSWKLAPTIWSLVEGGPQITWEQAATDKNHKDQVARCIAVCELMIRILDVVTSPTACHDTYHEEL